MFFPYSHWLVAYLQNVSCVHPLAFRREYCSAWYADRKCFSSLLFVVASLLNPRLNQKLFWWCPLVDRPKALICAPKSTKPRIHESILHGSLPAQLSGIKALPTQLDQWYEHILQLIWMTCVNFLITVEVNNTARQELRLVSWPLVSS